MIGEAGTFGDGGDGVSGAADGGGLGEVSEIVVVIEVLLSGLDSIKTNGFPLGFGGGVLIKPSSREIRGGF